MPKISVIIPVYNVEPYLRECLDSVINQTITDIEIICINDGSTDDSLSVLNEYKSKDNRIVVIDKKNEGVAITRNLGIKIVSGDYISFIDADDYLETNTFYEKLYTCALETNSDIVKGNYKFNNQVLNVVNNKIKENKIYFIAEFASAIYKTAFIKNNDIKFPILSDMEDPNFAFKCAIYANKIEIVDDANYVIVENPNSITRKKNSYSQLMDKLKGLKLLIKIANNSNIDINEFSYILAFWFVIVYKDILNKSNFFTKFVSLNILKKIFNKYKNEKIFLDYVTKYKNNVFYKIICKNIIANLFSLTNSKDKKHKIITILGIKIKIRRNNAKN